LTHASENILIKELPLGKVVGKFASKLFVYKDIYDFLIGGIAWGMCTWDY